MLHCDEEVGTIGLEGFLLHSDKEAGTVISVDLKVATGYEEEATCFI